MPDEFNPLDPADAAIKDAEKQAETEVDPLDAILAGHTPAMPSIAPDGGFQPMILKPIKMPAATPENVVCMRGPCRYYMETHFHAQLGNTEGTFEKHPKQKQRWCMRQSMQAINLYDESVLHCSEWHPYTPAELALREEARDLVRKEHPEFFTQDNNGKVSA